MPKSKPKYNSITFDSQEEIDFYKWCEEAKSLKIISDFKYHDLTDRVVLSENIKITTIDKHSKVLFRKHWYTPDFSLSFNKEDFFNHIDSCHLKLFSFLKLTVEDLEMFRSNLDLNKIKFLIDVKGNYCRNDGMRSFTYNQKWIYDKFKKIIVMVQPQKYFKEFGLPSKCLYTEKLHKLRKAYQDFKLLKFMI